MPRRGEPMNADAFDHDLLLAYVEGDLAADDAARLEGQLRQDPKLAGLLAGMRADRDALRRLPREAAPDTLALPVEQRLERSMLLEPVGEPEADVAARVRPVWRRVALGVAAAAVLAFGAAVTIAVMSGGDLMDHTLALFGHEPAGKPTTDAPAVAADEADPADDADTTGDGLAMADRPDGDDAAAERRRGGGSDDAADTIDADGTRPGGALAGVIPPRARGGADPALGGDAAGEAAADATSGEALDALGAGAATAPRFFTSLTDLTDFDVADDLALRVATACASDTQRDLVTWASGNNALVLVNDRRVVGYAVPATPPAEGWRIARPTDRWAADAGVAHGGFEEPVFDRSAGDAEAADTGGAGGAAEDLAAEAEAPAGLADAPTDAAPNSAPPAAPADITERYLVIEAERLPEVLAHLNRDRAVMQRANLVPVEKLSKATTATSAGAATPPHEDGARLRELRRLRAELVMLEVAEDNLRQLGEELEGRGKVAGGSKAGGGDAYDQTLTSLRQRIAKARARLDTEASAADASIVGSPAERAPVDARPGPAAGAAEAEAAGDLAEAAVAGGDAAMRPADAAGAPARAAREEQRFDWGGVLARQLPVTESEPIKVNTDRRVVLKLVIEPVAAAKAGADGGGPVATRPAESQPVDAAAATD